MSVDLLLDDLQREQGEFADSVEQNLEITQRQVERQIRGAGARRNSRVNAVQAPSFLSTALRIGGVGLDFAGREIARINRTQGA